MSLELNIDRNKSDEDIYIQLEKQLEHLIVSKDKIISNLSNFAAALKESFKKISWIGFYILQDQKLFLGPFQGNTACTEIDLGKGVCGTSAQNKSTVIVENVEDFPGHIACDSGSRSEIVVPIFVNNTVWGLLDLDSYGLSAFNEIDKLYLEQFCKFLVSRLELNNFAII